VTGYEEQTERLNRAAYMALQGLSNDPVSDLSALIASDCEIDPIVREELAAAIRGRPISDGIVLNVSGQNNHSVNAEVRKDRKRFERLRIGRQVEAHKATGLSEAEAVRAVMEDNILGKSLEFKAVEGCATFARKADSWLATAQIEFPDLHDLALEGVFCRADQLGVAPSQLLTAQLEALSALDDERRAHSSTVQTTTD